MQQLEMVVLPAGSSGGGHRPSCCCCAAGYCTPRLLLLPDGCVSIWSCSYHLLQQLLECLLIIHRWQGESWEAGENPRFAAGALCPTSILLLLKNLLQHRSICNDHRLYRLYREARLLQVGRGSAGDIDSCEL
jgi:hypothetical protein